MNAISSAIAMPPMGRAVQYRKCPLLPEETAWDGQLARQHLRAWAARDGDVDWKQYARGFAYVEAPSTPHAADFKLPHHDVMHGVLSTNWHGVAAAMAALLGSRSRLAMPEPARKAAYEHLARHYAEFGRTPPPLRDEAPEKAVRPTLSRAAAPPAPTRCYLS